MTSPDDLLAAIIADPANDDLRLVYADLLDDRGEEEYGEFIRVQCELARKFPAPEADHRCAERKSRRLQYTTEGKTLVIGLAARGNCKRCDWLWDREALRGRERELWTSCDVPMDGIPDEWIPTLDCDVRHIAEAPILHDGAFVIYRRGFVAEVRLSCADWLAHGPALVRRQPIERVVMNTCTPLCHTGLLRRVYTWACGENGPTTPYHLPNELFSFVDWDDAEPSDHSHGYVGWPTESAAIDALSKAALLFARQTEPATASE